MTELLFKEFTYRIRGACFEVYKEKGCGFLEAVYQNCLSLEFRMQRIGFVEKPLLTLEYKGIGLTCRYQPDFVCFDKIIVELKAVKMIDDGHRAQLHNYLKSTGLKLGLLVNFGHYPQVEIERIIRCPSKTRKEELRMT